jgi:MFS family permease
VLGYSALEFGLASVVMPVGAAVGSITGQAIATRGGVRAITVAGMTLTGLGSLLLAYVSVDGTYLEDIFFGLLVFGPGLGAAYVAGSIVSLAGIAESDAGLASGLNNSSFQIGGAVGVAILSTVAVSHAHGDNPLAALTNGYQAAFATAIVFAVLGLLVAVAFLQLRTQSGREASVAPARVQSRDSVHPRATAHADFATSCGQDSADFATDG